jgi:ribosomal protein L12E/L44/L45/RPP1/RPP2
MTIKKGSLGYYDKIHIVISDNIMKWVDDEGIMDMNEKELDTYLREKAMKLIAVPVDVNGEIVNTEIDYKENEESEKELEEESKDESDYETLYEQLKKQTQDAGMEVEEIEGKVVVTGRPT